IPTNAILGIVGDVNPEAMLKLVDKYFGTWNGTRALVRKLPDIPKPTTTKITIIDRPGSVQTNILAAKFAIRRIEPDYFALQVLNRILGASESGRLFLNLREVHGYTYGAYSSLFSDIYKGYWEASTEVRTAITVDAMRELLNELRRIRTEEVSAQDL